MKRIGITGTIGAGKSTVSILLRRRRFPVFDADGYGHICLYQNQPTYQMIVDEFGEGILDENKEIDRKALAACIFGNEESRQKLNEIIHPVVLEAMRQFFENHKQEDLVFAEVPLLFEAGWEKEFNHILVVTCQKDTAIQRLMESRGYSKKEALSRYESQMKKEEQINKADIVLENDGTIKELTSSLNIVLKELSKDNGTQGKR